MSDLAVKLGYFGPLRADLQPIPGARAVAFGLVDNGTISFNAIEPEDTRGAA
jgi:hypothetical protein